MSEEIYMLMEVVEDVDENVWEIVSCSDEYRQLQAKCKGISYSDRSIIIELSEENSSKEISRMQEFVSRLKEKDLQEIPVQETNSSTLDLWCREIQDMIGYDCCKYINGKSKVIAYCNNYDDFSRMRHILRMKTGQIKQLKGKQRRQRKTDGVQEKDLQTLILPREHVAMTHHRKQETVTFDCNTHTKHVETYYTAEGIKVLVYEGNILNLPVECIVNAANDSLQHGGGVAAVIAKAAGHLLTEEGNRHIRKFESVPVGTTFTSTAGKLKYNCVIHAVGPRWSDYSPFTLAKVQECEQHLYLAIYNSFLAAEKRKLKSIALPSISSGIFGVPEEICVYQYAKATADYSRKSHDQQEALKEIHFIDKNYKIVRKTEATFQQWFREGRIPYYDSKWFVKSFSRQRSCVDKSKSSGGTQSNCPSHRHGQAEHQTPSDETPATLSEPLSFFDYVFSAYAYLLSGREEQSLLLSRGDIFKTKATAIVVPYDQRGGHGQLARALVSKIPSFKTSDYTLRLSSGSKDKKLSDVFLTDGFNCGYQYILHAVFPASTSGKMSQERKPIVQKLYDSIFSFCAKDSKVSSVVTTLLGTDMTRGDVKMCAEIFLQSYIQNCLQQQSQGRLRVHLVCTAESYEIVKDVLDNYIMGKKAISEQSMDIPNRNFTDCDKNSGQ